MPTTSTVYADMPAGGAAMMSAVLIHVQVSSVHVCHATLEDFVISNVGK